MTPDKELTELRDTLAIEITRELLRGLREGVPKDEFLRVMRHVYEMADAVLSGRSLTPPTLTGWYSPDRCQVCGWPLAESPEKGCIPASCSFRPDEHTQEYKQLQKRKDWLGAHGGRWAFYKREVESTAVAE